MRSISTRLKLFLDKNGVSINHFEKQIGASNGLIGKAIREERDIGSSYIEKIVLANPDLNPDWLLTGRGNMIKATAVGAESFSMQGSNRKETRINGGFKHLPLIPVEAMAGYAAGEVTYGDTDMTYYVVPEFKEADFFIRLRGDSMRPRYNHGDVVACKFVREPQFLQWGKIYVLDTEQGPVIKKLVAGDAADEITAISTNPEYPPFTIKKEHVRAFALVLGAICFE